ncbi:MAG: hypothetical protein DRN49_02755 [Thaumarchaeota archaeon]|nr:MAG: hypothetical protein DRN49_02755 [Nitrososphaerota archaeon]
MAITVIETFNYLRMRYDHPTPEYAECDICGSNRHLCLSIPIPREGRSENLSVCIMCAKRIAKAYTRFVATVKSRSYQYWYREREKMRRAGIGSGLEKQDKKL